MVKIEKASYKEIKDFRKREWASVDKENYGKAVDWNERKYLFKAIENDELVGSLKLTTEAGVAEIHNIIVSAIKRNQGIGKNSFKEQRR